MGPSQFHAAKHCRKQQGDDLGCWVKIMDNFSTAKRRHPLLFAHAKGLAYVILLDRNCRRFQCTVDSDGSCVRVMKNKR